jgi:archaellum component FlaD/FlaE
VKSQCKEEEEEEDDSDEETQEEEEQSESEQSEQSEEEESEESEEEAVESEEEEDDDDNDDEKEEDKEEGEEAKPSEKINGTQAFEIKEILDTRRSGGGHVEYLVRWLGGGHPDSWQDCVNAPEAVRNFEQLASAKLLAENEFEQMKIKNIASNKVMLASLMVIAYCVCLLLLPFSPFHVVVLCNNHWKCGCC